MYATEYTDISLALDAARDIANRNANARKRGTRPNSSGIRLSHQVDAIVHMVSHAAGLDTTQIFQAAEAGQVEHASTFDQALVKATQAALDEHYRNHPIPTI